MRTPLNVVENYMRLEADLKSPSMLHVKILKSGEFSARLAFAPGMETAQGSGATLEDALAELARTLEWAAA